MKHLTIALLLVMVMAGANAQKYITKNGYIRFFSDAPLEKIEAQNRQVNAAWDMESGQLAFKVLIKAFQFEKALMQEHFNENYMESGKYPDATFSGTVTDLNEADFQKDVINPVTLIGKMTIHGVTKDIEEKGTLQMKEGKIIGKAKFFIKLKDYNINIPQAVVKNISDRVEVTVDVTLEKLVK
ncbi:MAG: YceI family protein [Bacteroidetes bacterium]|nr:YceI family protein [Bacteroidota bacterium]